MSFLGAAKTVLQDEGNPLHADEITRRAIAAGLVESAGKTPAATMQAVLATDIKRNGEKSAFFRAAPAIYGLRGFESAGAGEPPALEKDRHVRVPHFPTYERTRAVLRVWDGVPRTTITGMRSAIGALSGTPQNTVDWSEPDVWIDERLAGEPQELARRIWEESSKEVNPRYTTGYWLLATNYDLLSADAAGIMHLTDRGKDFIEHPAGRTEQEVDEAEGLFTLLSLVADSGPAARGDLLESWGQYLRSESNIRSDAAIKSSMWARLRNLLRRQLLERVGRSYVATDEGLEYLKGSGYADEVAPDEYQKLLTLLSDQKTRVREVLREILAEIDPFAFEYVVKDLLEAIGYEDVEVTAPSGDKGVDVIGNIQLGITSVKEVVQVKRHGRSIQRHVLDALRGSLHRFGAVRGTIITTGKFSRGTKEAAFEPGAAPITLIDGEKLIDLLIENGIGVRKKRVELLNVDTNAFSGTDVADESEE